MRELDEKLLNIIDMQFLYGYYEPTLLILFEPNQTWPGCVPSSPSSSSSSSCKASLLTPVPKGGRGREAAISPTACLVGKAQEIWTQVFREPIQRCGAKDG